VGALTNGWAVVVGHLPESGVQLPEKGEILEFGLSERIRLGLSFRNQLEG